MKRLALCLIVLCGFAAACAVVSLNGSLVPIFLQRPEGGAGRDVPDRTNMLGFQDCAGQVIALGRVTASDHELSESIFAVGDGKDGATVQLHPLNKRLELERNVLPWLVGEAAELVIRCAQAKEATK